MFALVLVAVLVGALSQRVAGMGFALVASPVLVLAMGPFDGVLVANLCGALSSAILLTRVWSRIEWRRFVGLAIPAVLAVVPGALIAATLPVHALEVTIGVLILIALSLSLIASRAGFEARGPVPVAIAGTASGLMSAISATSGPPISVYAIASRWPQRSFAATMQPYFVVVGLTSLVVKVGFDGWRTPALEWWQWAEIVAALLIALVVGEFVHHRVSERAARIAVIIISVAGAISAILHGIGVL